MKMLDGWKIACWMAMVSVAIPSMGVVAQCDDERIEAPGAVVHGKTIGEWTAVWWQWMAGLPAEGHPFVAARGDDCARDQNEPVFLLSGSILSLAIGPPVLPWEGCVVPCGKPILLEVWSVSLWAPGDCEPDRMEDCMNLAAEYMDTVSIEVTLDGRPLPCPERHREKSPVFDFLMAPDNILDLEEPLLRKGVTDGFWVMLKPLPPGVHVIDLRVNDSGLELPRLYRITVAPCESASFRRGDADGNQAMDLTDAVAIIEHLVMGRALACTDAADSDDSGVLDLTDAIYTLNHLFLSGPAPAAPGPHTCGADPTADDDNTCRTQC
jgi:hypothetical protein